MNDAAAGGASLHPADLIYGLNDKPPLRLSCFVALQHVLAVFVGIVTPPTLIARALELPGADGAFLVSMALLTSGVGTLLQTRQVGPVGSGLLNIQGTSFVFVTPIVSLAGAIMGSGGSREQALAAKLRDGIAIRFRLVRNAERVRAFVLIDPKLYRRRHFVEHGRIDDQKAFVRSGGIVVQ